MLKLDLERIDFLKKKKKRINLLGCAEKKYKIGEYLAYPRPGAEYKGQECESSRGKSSRKFNYSGHDSAMHKHELLNCSQRGRLRLLLISYIIYYLYSLFRNQYETWSRRSNMKKPLQ